MTKISRSEPRVPLPDPWIYAIKKWSNMPEAWRNQIDINKVCRRGILCTGYYTHTYMESGFCSHHCRLEHDEEQRCRRASLTPKPNASQIADGAGS